MAGARPAIEGVDGTAQQVGQGGQLVRAGVSLSVGPLGYRFVGHVQRRRHLDPLDAPQLHQFPDLQLSPPFTLTLFQTVRYGMIELEVDSFGFWKAVI